MASPKIPVLLTFLQAMGGSASSPSSTDQTPVTCSGQGRDVPCLQGRLLALFPALGQAHLLAQQTTATARAEDAQETPDQSHIATVAHAPVVPDAGNMDAHTQVC